MLTSSPPGIEYNDQPCLFNFDIILEGMQLGLQNIRELEEYEEIFVDLCRERGVLLDYFPPYLASMIKHVKGLTL